MQLQFEDEVSIRGRLVVSKVFPNGETELHYEDDNLITDYARALMLALVYDTTGGVRPDPIRSFQVGSGGVANTSTPGSILAGVPSMTSLRAPLQLGTNTLSHNRSSVTPGNLSANTPLDITFSFGVPNSSLVDNYISEAGMFTQAGNLFSYKSFPALLKTAEFSIQFTWTITYV